MSVQEGRSLTTLPDLLSQSWFGSGEQAPFRWMNLLDELIPLNRRLLRYARNDR
jgi:hypothetical protein